MEQLKEELYRKDQECKSYCKREENMVADHAALAEDFRAKLAIAERKYDELLA